MNLDRRTFMAGLAASIGTIYGGSCTSTASPTTSGSPRLTARPHAPAQTLAPGAHALPASVGGSVTLYLPANYRPEQPAALAVMLHGAGQSRELMHNFYPLADAANVILLIPKSRGRTWDLLVAGFGDDVQLIDRSLAYAFDHCVVNEAKLAIGGFSDGASYALSLGISNGDLFRWIDAFSPGFMHSDTVVGKPAVFIAHGTDDSILSVTSSRNIVQRLRQGGYAVTYEEFEGPHTIRQIDVERAFGLLNVTSD